MVISSRADATAALSSMPRQSFRNERRLAGARHIRTRGASALSERAILALALKPYAVSGQEWRAVQANFSEFFARSAMDWEKFTPEMEELLTSGAGLPADSRWSPRCLQACVFCARRFWQEELLDVYLAGSWCFMQNPSKVCKMLHYSALSKVHRSWLEIAPVLI